MLLFGVLPLWFPMVSEFWAPEVLPVVPMVDVEELLELLLGCWSLTAPLGAPV